MQNCFSIYRDLQFHPASKMWMFVFVCYDNVKTPLEIGLRILRVILGVCLNKYNYNSMFTLFLMHLLESVSKVNSCARNAEFSSVTVKICSTMVDVKCCVVY